MNGRGYYNYTPRAQAPVNTRGANRGGGGSNAGLIVAVIFGFVLSAGAVAWFLRNKSSTDQSLATASLTAAQMQAITNPPATSAPLCPNNYAPVTDRYGKVYQNACYADSVGAQYAPTPYTTVPVAPGVDPTTTALLARLPAGVSLPAGIRVTRAPVVINQAGQRVGGGILVQGAATRAPVLLAQK